MLCCCRGSKSKKYTVEEGDETENKSVDNPVKSSVNKVGEAQSESCDQPLIDKVVVSETPTEEPSTEKVEVNKPLQSSAVIVDNSAGDSHTQPLQSYSVQSQGAVTIISIGEPTSQTTDQEEAELMMAAEVLAGLLKRLETVTSRLENVSPGGQPRVTGSSTATEVIAPFVYAFDDIIKAPVAKFVSLSEQIGGDVQTQAALFHEAFKAQRLFLVLASNSKKPAQNVLSKLLEPTSSKLQDVQGVRDKAPRSSEFFNHLSAVSECVFALGWVSVEPTPGPYVKEMSDACQFYTNRVIKDYKDKNRTHVEWARSLLQVWTELQAYIKQHHTTGLTWNPKGTDASATKTAAPPPPPPAGGGPPPPPPPVVQPPTAGAASSATDDSAQRAALFDQLNRGGDVTKGLKKVSEDLKTHKNPALRSGPKPFKAPAPTPTVTTSVAAPAKQEVQKPPVCELQGKKWIVEYQKGNRNITIDQTETKQSVYIFRCVDSVITVKNKVNSIIMDNCKKTAVVFDDVICGVEFVNCQSVQCQVLGKVSTVSIDKSDGCQVYLSKDSLNAEFVTSKSSEMNILIPKDDGEFGEFAVPEQFKTKWDGKKLVTSMTDIAG